MYSALYIIRYLADWLWLYQ